MESGDYVKFNENARPRYLCDAVVRVLAVSDSSVAIKVPKWGFPGDELCRWKPGSVYLAPLDYIDLYQKRGS